jgi:hypothetical protein
MTNGREANDSNASLRRYQKNELRCGQCFRNLEKFRSLRHCLATGRLKATDDPHEVAFLNNRSAAQSA